MATKSAKNSVLALAYKGVDYETKPVNLIKDGGEQHTKDYQSINPAEIVPSLVVDGHTLTESNTIFGAYTHMTLSGLKVRSLALQIACGIQPIQNLRVLQYVGDETKAEWGRHWIDQGLSALEKALEKCAGKFCYGDNLSLADCCLVPQVFNAMRFKVDMSKFPIISRLNETLLKHPACVASHPLKQPDCPEDLKKNGS